MSIQWIRHWRQICWKEIQGVFGYVCFILKVPFSNLKSFLFQLEVQIQYFACEKKLVRTFVFLLRINPGPSSLCMMLRTYFRSALWSKAHLMCRFNILQVKKLVWVVFFCQHLIRGLLLWARCHERTFARDYEGRRLCWNKWKFLASTNISSNHNTALQYRIKLCCNWLKD